MPVRRDKDGNIIEEPTRFIPDAAIDNSTAPASSPSASSDATVVISQTPPAHADEMTRAIGVPKIDPAAAGQSTPLGGPVVGWLVVIKGPGRGNFVPLGYGRNSIGRAPSERASINFGDNNISRARHAVVTYDPRGRKFYLGHGDSDNLTYLGDRPVLGAEELPPLADIGVGETVLRFVPLCGDEFDWQDDAGDNNAE